MASPPAQCLEDDPRQSSAAQCISLNLLGENFGPEFTHQCFQGEFIPGYQPSQCEQSSHVSHQHHDEATHELQVQVQLSPSCRQCQVSVNIEPKPQAIVERALKRPRIEENEHKALSCVEAASSEAEPVSNIRDGNSGKQYSEENLHPNECTNVNESTPERPMPVDEVISHCAKALPAIVTGLPQEDYLPSPVGTVVKEYQQKGIDFVVSFANGSDAAEYHKEVQTLAIWFIETAENVDLTSSQGGGYWKVLYIFRKHEDNKYSLVGFMTVFHFLSPFKKPKSGRIARVCQVLILPPYQRMGHGKVLLQQLYDIVHDNSNDIVEINVEDPAPACTCLRNRLDYELLKDSFDSETPWLDSSYYSLTDVADPNFFKPVSDVDAVQAGAIGCITPRQVQIAHEIYKLSLLPHDCSQDVQKKYRLMVKKRLIKVHREELGGCESKEEKQGMLAKVFDDTLEQYKSVLRQSKKRGNVPIRSEYQ